jgi:transposase
MRMQYLAGVERNQSMLLPRSVEEYVSAENPVRAIDAFMEGLDVQALGFSLREEKDAGAPGYHPRELLKLYLYGYLNRIRSSRELEKATHRNLEVIWLVRELKPDHWTISNFRKLHRERFRKVFREFALVCARLGLFGADLVAIDSSHFQAVNSPKRNFTKAKVQALLEQIDQKSEAYLQDLETADQAAPSQGRGGKDEAKSLREKLAQLEAERQRCSELMQALEASETGQVSQTDADSRRLKKGDESVVGYNVQIAVDGQHHLIVAEQVTQENSDWQMLSPMAAQAKEALGVERLRVVADAGYCSHEQISRCADLGIEANVPNGQHRAAGRGAYAREKFRYDAPADVCICPRGQSLHRHRDNTWRGLRYQVYYNVSACAQCPVRAECTKGRYRKLRLAEGHELFAAAQERWRTQPELRQQRRSLVEHPFGTLKFWWGMRAFLCRGLQAVQAEFSFAALAYNFRRVLNVLGTAKLIGQLQASRAH